MQCIWNGRQKSETVGCSRSTVRQNEARGVMNLKAVIPFFVLALALPGLGCQHDLASQGAISTGPVVSELQVPEPELVPYANIPYPVPNTLYRISGSALADDPAEILERVLGAGFDLRRAWHPQVALCTALFVDELIIELKEPDDAIYELGFTSDFSKTVGPCASHWNEYNFVSHE
jgi:hypothetical protein